MSKMSATEQAADVAALLRSSEQTPLGTVPDKRITCVFFIIARTTKHLDVGRYVFTSPGKRFDVVKLQFTTFPTSSTSSLGTCFNCFEFSSRHPIFAIPLFPRSPIEFTGLVIFPISRESFEQCSPANGVILSFSSVVLPLLFGIGKMPVTSDFPSMIRIGKPSAPHPLPFFVRIFLLPAAISSFLFLRVLLSPFFQADKLRCHISWVVSPLLPLIFFAFQTLAFTALAMLNVSLSDVTVLAWLAGAVPNQTQASTFSK